MFKGRHSTRRMTAFSFLRYYCLIKWLNPRCDNSKQISSLIRGRKVVASFLVNSHQSCYIIGKLQESIKKEMVK